MISASTCADPGQAVGGRSVGAVGNLNSGHGGRQVISGGAIGPIGAYRGRGFGWYHI